jgi:general stress protein 26
MGKAQRRCGHSWGPLLSHTQKEMTMDSINKNQIEDNHTDLFGTDAIQRIQHVVDKTQTCFFCTHALEGPTSGTRPMSVQQVGEDGILWFLSASDSHKNAEIAHSPNVDLYFQGTEHSDFLHLSGHAVISNNKAKIKELWKPILKTWFTEGEDDPRISVLKVTPLSGYYWDNKHGNVVAGVKMLIGAAIGKTLDDSIEGRLDF